MQQKQIPKNGLNIKIHSDYSQSMYIYIIKIIHVHITAEPAENGQYLARYQGLIHKALLVVKGSWHSKSCLSTIEQ
jgi:hypothetical protein